MEYSEQELLRRESLTKLRELGVEPYPAAEYPVNATAAEITAGYDPEKGNSGCNRLQHVENNHDSECFADKGRY